MTHHDEHPTDMLPWYMTSTLPEVERQQVESHLLHCPQCQLEMNLLSLIRTEAGKPVEGLPVDFAWHRLQRDIKTHKPEHSQTGWKLAAIAASIIIAIQTITIIIKDHPADTYSPAGQQQTGLVVQVRFHANSREAYIRNALQAIDAEIVAGPSSTGLYRIRLGDDKNTADKDNKILLLRQYPKLIDYIEID